MKPPTDGARRRGLDVPRARETAADGILVVDKPAGVTSHDVVAAMRRLCATRKVGHAGTLDPMATGVLLIGVGKATRLLRFLTGADKDYRTTMVLGASRDSDDADGELTATSGLASLALPDLEAAMAKQRGNIMQVPATVSAIKVGGKRAHALHREGQDVKLTARPVRVDCFQMLAPMRAAALDTSDGQVPVVEVDAQVTCSAGTYVRALARDVGQELGCGAYLKALQRTRVGQWDLGEAKTVGNLVAQVEETGKVTPIPLTQVCSKLFHVWQVDQEQARRLANGNTHGLDVPAVEGFVAAHYRDRVVAILERRRGAWQPAVVLETDIE
ncbi:MAG: tRNA pseudouridine(55) synthase TruB [Actinomycetaceae bacterium]|nr:tRNA pseudouridine(55) synthase TruB [Actinomycetaceae bacterium]